MIKAYGEWVILELSAYAHSGLIILPDSHNQTNPTCRLLSVGDKVPGNFWKPGETVFCKSFINDRTQNKFTLKEAPGAIYFFTNYKNVLARLVGNKWWPVGDYVLIKRDMQIDRIGAVELPENIKSAYQDLGGTVVRFGLQTDMKKGYDPQLTIGDHVIIEQWDMNIHEIGIRNEGYHLMVPPKQLQYKDDPE